MVYPALLQLMRTTRLPVVDRTDAPADLNGLVSFAERRNLVSISNADYHLFGEYALPQMSLFRSARCSVWYKFPKNIFNSSRNRPGVAQRVPGGLGSQISMTFGK